MGINLQGAVVSVVTIAIALFVAAYVLPTPLRYLSNSTGAISGSINSGVLAVFQILLPIIVVLAIGTLFLKKMQNKD